MKAIITFQGFTESERQITGTEDLFFQVIRKYASEEITTYHPRMWTTDVETLAKQLRRQGINQIAIVSYSHGQAAACDLARIAPEYGLRIGLWLACDPVYRPTWLPRTNFLQPLAFRAMTRSATIKVPAGVRKVVWCRQHLSLPCGHTLIAESPNTVISPAQVLKYTHTTIDHASEWHETVKTELGTWAKLS